MLFTEMALVLGGREEISKDTFCVDHQRWVRHVLLGWHSDRYSATIRAPGKVDTRPLLTKSSGRLQAYPVIPYKHKRIRKQSKRWQQYPCVKVITLASPILLSYH